MNGRSKLAIVSEGVAGTVIGGGGDYLAGEYHPEVDSQQLQGSGKLNGTAGSSLGGRFPTKESLRQKHPWRRVMTLLKKLMGLWRGDVVEQEIKLNQEVISDVRRVIWEARRAQLDGEDSWLRPERKSDDKD
jgi:hypothetical protein